MSQQDKESVLVNFAVCEIHTQFEHSVQKFFETNDIRAAAEQIPQVQIALTEVLQRLETQQRHASRLTLRASVSGTILGPADIPAVDLEDALPTWSGSPLDEQNLGALLEPGTLFCVIGDPDRMEAVLIIDHTDIEYIHIGQTVAIQLDEYPTSSLEGEIEEIAYTDLRRVPRNLSHKAGGHINTVTDETGQERALSPSYQARVRLADSDARLLSGFRGRGRIHVGNESIAQQIWRGLGEALLFK